MRRGPTCVRLLWLSALALPLSCAFGCGGGAAELKAMQGDLAKIQRDHDSLEKRVGMLEDDRKADAVGRPSPASGPKGDNAPAAPASTKVAGSTKLKVVKLEPKVDEPAEVPGQEPVTPSGASVAEEDDDGPRPMLKIGPSGAIEQTFPDDGAASIKKKPKVGGGKGPTLDPQAVTDYEAAVALVKAKKLKPALDAFAGFILRYPDHPYVANATYWRGECYYSLGEYASAAAQLEGMLARFPASVKVPDALLKLGMTHKKLGSPAKAKEAYARLRKEFPLSEAAKKIPPEDAP